MARTVYIETTIPSYYYETRRTSSAIAWCEATRRWWDRYRTDFILVTSKYVLAELGMAPPAKRIRMLDLMKQVSVVEDPPGLNDVVAYYIEHSMMPADAQGDAAHLALASMYSVDFLLTWNCRHLANVNKIQHIEVLNGRLGLSSPVITTPLTLLSEDVI
jgi:hypothetical protein